MKLLRTLVPSLSLLGSSLLAEKVISKLWKSLTGKTAPYGKARISEAVIFAVFAAVITTLVEQIVFRGASRWLEDPELQDLAAEEAGL